MANQTKSIIIIAILAIIIGWLGSKLIDTCKTIDHFKVERVSYQVQIDSMQCVIDTAMARYDREYAKNAKVIIRNRIKYIIQNTGNEKQFYFTLDPTGRVAYFSKWVRERSKKPIPIPEEGGVDELLHN